MIWTKPKLRMFIVIVIVILLAACKPADKQGTKTAQSESKTAGEAGSLTKTTIVKQAITPTVVQQEPANTPETPAETKAQEPLNAEPQEIVFEASDGEQLHGTYYPGAKKPSPLVVLMHWAGGDENNWVSIAYWLQNRGLSNPDAENTSIPWLDASWFPPVDKNLSYAVFTFTFRGCEGGCKKIQAEKWLLDAQAAMEQAALLDGIDAHAIVAIGASIGADAVVDGCAWIDKKVPGTCVGALSLSPGGYLNLPYPPEAEKLNNMVSPVPVRCMYSTGDVPAAKACKQVKGDSYKSVEYNGERHGMELIVPEIEPNVLAYIQDFLKEIWAK